MNLRQANEQKGVLYSWLMSHTYFYEFNIDALLLIDQKSFLNSNF